MRFPWQQERPAPPEPDAAPSVMVRPRPTPLLIRPGPLGRRLPAPMIPAPLPPRVALDRRAALRFATDGEGDHA